MYTIETTLSNDFYNTINKIKITQDIFAYLKKRVTAYYRLGGSQVIVEFHTL